jgi:hypothetical protein
MSTKGKYSSDSQNRVDHRYGIVRLPGYLSVLRQSNMRVSYSADMFRVSRFGHKNYKKQAANQRDPCFSPPTAWVILLTREPPMNVYITPVCMPPCQVPRLEWWALHIFFGFRYNGELSCHSQINASPVREKRVSKMVIMPFWCRNLYYSWLKKLFGIVVRLLYTRPSCASTRLQDIGRYLAPKNHFKATRSVFGSLRD